MGMVIKDLEMAEFNLSQWALILGGSSGFGLAAAKKFAAQGMSVCIIHRDRRGAMARIEQDFSEIKSHDNGFISLNIDALQEDSLEQVSQALIPLLEQTNGKIKLLLHSIAFGNLKPIAPIVENTNPQQGLSQLANQLDIPLEKLCSAIDSIDSPVSDQFFPLKDTSYNDNLIENEDLARTIHSMGSSLLSWTQYLFKQNLFDKDARIIGLTSEGNEIAWRGYAAVSAAKVVLESIIRSIAVEYAPYGLRANVLQPGVTDTPALNAIPGSDTMKAVARLKNPFKRLTTPEDVANVIALLCREEATWINGAIIPVDGGEKIGSL